MRIFEGPQGEIIMFKFLRSSAAFFTLAFLSSTALAGDRPLSRIAFGSCVHQDKPQPIWDAVIATDPELFVFLGDNIYADTKDMDVMRAKYQQLADQPGFKKLKAKCPVIATWDDHDYGA